MSNRANIGGFAEKKNIKTKKERQSTSFVYAICNAAHHTHLHFPQMTAADSTAKYFTHYPNPRHDTPQITNCFVRPESGDNNEKFGRNQRPYFNELLSGPLWYITSPLNVYAFEQEQPVDDSDLFLPPGPARSQREIVQHYFQSFNGRPYKILINHNQALKLLREWKTRNVYFLVATHGWYIFKKTRFWNQWKPEEKRGARLMCLLPSAINTQNAAKTIRMFLLMDKYLFIRVLCKMVKLSLLAPLSEEWKGKICHLMERPVTVTTKTKKGFKGRETTTKRDSLDIMQLIRNNAEKSLEELYILLLDKYGKTHEEVYNAIILKPETLGGYLQTPVKDSVSLLSRVQGRDSEFRKLTTKTIPSFHAQIALRPELHINEVILPASLRGAFVVGQRLPPVISAERLANSHPLSKDYFIELDGFMLVNKRDPVISVGSLNSVTRVAFVDDDRFYFGNGAAFLKNSDFDGDRQVLWIIYWSKMTYLEVMLNNDPRYGTCCLYTVPQYAFTESFVVAMHGRRLPTEFPLLQRRLFDLVRQQTMRTWLNDKNTRDVLGRFLAKFGTQIRARGFGNFVKFIDPTKKILNRTIVAIDALHGPEHAYQFYGNVVRHLVQSNCQYTGCKCNYKYQRPTLFMEHDVLNEAVLRMLMSEASGTMEVFVEYLETFLTSGPPTWTPSNRYYPQTFPSAETPSFSALPLSRSSSTADRRYHRKRTHDMADIYQRQDNNDNNNGESSKDLPRGGKRTRRSDANRTKKGEGGVYGNGATGIMNLHTNKYSDYQSYRDHMQENNNQLAKKSQNVSIAGNRNFQQQKMMEHLRLGKTGALYIGRYKIFDNINTHIPQHFRLPVETLEIFISSCLDQKLTFPGPI